MSLEIHGLPEKKEAYPVIVEIDFAHV